MRRITLVLAALLLAGCGSPAQAPVSITSRAGVHKPSPLIGSLNPAVTQATIGKTVCVPGWTAKVRPPASYTSALKRKQLPAGAVMRDYEEDHLMPLALGGAPKDPANLQPVPIKRAKSDDVWETRLHEQVCNGSVTLHAAQVKISQIKRGNPTSGVSVSVTSVAASGWMDQLMPTGTICVQAGTQTTWPAAVAARAWNATDASMVAKVSCAGYARSMTVMIVSYSSSTDGLCAKTGSANGWTWRNVRGAWVWTPNAPTIWVNQWSRVRSWCQGTYKRRLMITSHELGHVLGLSHASGVTVMLPYTNERYTVPTVYDVARVNRRY